MNKINLNDYVHLKDAEQKKIKDSFFLFNQKFIVSNFLIFSSSYIIIKNEIEITN